MIPFKIGDKSFEFPSTYEEITLGQFLKIRNLKDGEYIDYLSILCNLSKEELYACPHEDIDFHLIPRLEEIVKDPKFNFPLPKFVNVGTKRAERLVKVPTVMESSYFQKTEIEKIYRKAFADADGEEVDLMQYYPQVLAIYFHQHLLGKKETSIEWTKAVDKVLQWPIEIALPLGSFFLKSWVHYYNLKAKQSDTTQTRKKSKLVFPGLKSLESLTPFIHLRMVMLKGLIRFFRWSTARFFQSSIGKQKLQNIEKRYSVS